MGPLSDLRTPLPKGERWATWIQDPPRSSGSRGPGSGSSVHTGREPAPGLWHPPRDPQQLQRPGVHSLHRISKQTNVIIKSQPRHQHKRKELGHTGLCHPEEDTTLGEETLFPVALLVPTQVPHTCEPAATSPRRASLLPTSPNCRLQCVSAPPLPALARRSRPRTLGEAKVCDV